MVWPNTHDHLLLLKYLLSNVIRTRGGLLTSDTTFSISIKSYTKPHFVFFLHGWPLLTWPYTIWLLKFEICRQVDFLLIFSPFSYFPEFHPFFVYVIRVPNQISLATLHSFLASLYIFIYIYFIFICSNHRNKPCETILPLF